MTKMATMPIYDKKNPFQNSSLREPMTDFHETWYGASVASAYYSLFK